MIPPFDLPIENAQKILRFQLPRLTDKHPLPHKLLFKSKHIWRVNGNSTDEFDKYAQDLIVYTGLKFLQEYCIFRV